MSLRVSTLTVKIKKTKTFVRWFQEQSKKAAALYNECLNLQMIKINCGSKILSAYDLANEFRSFDLASDYKDRIYERIATSTSNWVKSESFRYNLYWQHKEKNEILNNKVANIKYPFLEKINKLILQTNEYKKPGIKRYSGQSIKTAYCILGNPAVITYNVIFGQIPPGNSEQSSLLNLRDVYHKKN